MQKLSVMIVTLVTLVFGKNYWPEIRRARQNIAEVSDNAPFVSV